MTAVTCSSANPYRSGRASALSMRRRSVGDQDESFAYSGSARLRPRALHRRELMAHLFLFRLQIPSRRIGGGNFEWNPFANRQAVALDANELARVVAHQAHTPHAQLAENLDAHPVIALVGLEAEALVGFHGVE